MSISPDSFIGDFADDCEPSKETLAFDDCGEEDSIFRLVAGDELKFALVGVIESSTAMRETDAEISISYSYIDTVDVCIYNTVYTIPPKFQSVSFR